MLPRPCISSPGYPLFFLFNIYLCGKIFGNIHAIVLFFWEKKTCTRYARIFFSGILVFFLKKKQQGYVFWVLPEAMSFFTGLPSFFSTSKYSTLFICAAKSSEIFMPLYCFFGKKKCTRYARFFFSGIISGKIFRKKHTPSEACFFGVASYNIMQ